MTPATEQILKATLRNDCEIAPQQIVQVLAMLKGKPAPDAAVAAILLTQAQAARFLNCSRFTIRRLEIQGRIKPVVLTPDLKRYRRTDLEALVAGD